MNCPICNTNIDPNHKHFCEPIVPPESRAARSSEESSPSSALLERFGVTSEEARAQIKPLFMWMYDHGITDLRIERNVTQAQVTIDGKAL